MHKKKTHIIGGGTISHVRSHLALCAPAFGETAKKLADLCDRQGELEVKLHLTRMAGGNKTLETNEDVKKLIAQIVEAEDTKIIFMNAAMCDFEGTIDYTPGDKYAQRLKSREMNKPIYLSPSDKVIHSIRKSRKDIFLVGFKTTTNLSEDEQYIAGLELLKGSSCNLVLANDVVTRKNMIITPEEARYCVTQDRDKALKELVEMAYLRSHLTFTRSTVVAGEPVPWSSPMVFSALRTVVDYCIEENAYKPFRGSTVGHFACKLSDNTFLTSIRKSNFNDLKKNGLVKITTDGPDTVIAYGSKPSVGGQSQRIVFSEHPEYDCIVHFHSPKLLCSKVPTVSQREYECGSHQCGQNTSSGLKQFGNLSAVYLDQHGPNIVFHHSIDPKEVIDFIRTNFALSEKTGGPVYVEKAIA
jgi:hypothetical protein